MVLIWTLFMQMACIKQSPPLTFSKTQDISFAAILDDFIPRYVEILTSGRFKESIKEIRVEGHTSTFWTTATTKLDAYFKNMGPYMVDFPPRCNCNE